ncbi:Phage regulatory protein Rha [Oryzisolibacter propanilivorax]|uniref:Phage regulatory protein Rha n=1 Tax=Oryzisolibacter propanilivorax TaxID=1527607 RepID=A0A1G9TYI2_9BURK|nr:Rha family transcriptional regulator [Oryzisolibacter propanilivorax]SDM52742.1 Phage regulatory protein Rha [Oryzisolibacter propanilivorax]
MLTIPAITMCKDAPRVDSRLLARHLHVQHKNTMELLERHRADFQCFGVVPFQTEKPMGTQGGRPERFALLNEDQAFLLLTYSRNTTRVRGLKVSLVEAFGEARRAAELRRAEYLPSYHLAHDALRGLGRDPAHQRHLHTNVNRLLNRTAGIEAGQRAHAQHGSLAVLAVGQMLAARAAAGARDDRDAYARIKQMLAPLQALAAPAMGGLSC